MTTTSKGGPKPKGYKPPNPLNLLPSIDTSDIDIPQELRDASPVNQLMIMLTALGYTQHEIANMLDNKSQSSVSECLKKYDPERVICNSPALRKKLVSARWLKKEQQYMDAITPEKIESSSAAQLNTMAAIARDKQEKLSERDEGKGGDNAGDLVLRLRLDAS